MDRVWQERAIRSWFSMWLEGKAGDLTALFTPDVQYIESWGPEYRGVSQVRHWFQEWNTRGRVLVWELGAPARRGPLCGGVVLQKYGGWQDGGI